MRTGVDTIDFSRYKNPEELKKATGLSVVQAIKINNLEIEKLLNEARR